MGNAMAIALLGVALVLTAAVFDAEPLYVPGVTFLVLALGSAAWVLAAANGVRVHRTVALRRVHEEEPVAVEIVVSAAGLPLPAGTIEDDLLPYPVPIPFDRRVTRVRINARYRRRGPKHLEPPRVVVRDPLGLASRTVTADEAAEVLVLPRLERVRTPHGEGRGTGLARSMARPSRPALAAEVELDGLRPQREGAPASRIYWQALARGGELLERKLVAEGDTRPLVVLDLRTPDSPDAADAAVRATASLAFALAKAGGCALLLPGDRRPSGLDPTLAGWPALLVRLALLETEAVPNLSGVAARRGPVLYVAARVVSRAPRALAHAPNGGRVLVVPGGLPGRTPVLEVAGCRGYELGAERASARRRMAAEAGAAAARSGP
jgi:uncharacterized protein (DUF58 family)